MRVKVTRNPTSKKEGKPAVRKTVPGFSLRDRILLAVPAGIFLFLLIYSSERFSSPVQEIGLIVISVVISILVFMISKDYVTCALAQSFGLLFSLVYFAAAAYKEGISFSRIMTFGTSFHIGLVWVSGLLITVLIRLFSRGKWDSRKRRSSFLKAFHLSSAIFLICYAGLLVLLFYAQRTVDLDGQRSLNLIPLKGAFAIYWPHILAGEFRHGIFIQFFGNLLIFTPLGFYMSVYFKKTPWFVIILLPMILSGAIETTQYVFNMGKSDIDDFWMNVLGYWLGFLLCMCVGWIRRLVTKGEEKSIW